MALCDFADVNVDKDKYSDPQLVFSHTPNMLWYKPAATIDCIYHWSLPPTRWSGDGVGHPGPAEVITDHCLLWASWYSASVPEHVDEHVSHWYKQILREIWSLSTHTSFRYQLNTFNIHGRVLTVKIDSCWRLDSMKGCCLTLHLLYLDVRYISSPPSGSTPV